MRVNCRDYPRAYTAPVNTFGDRLSRYTPALFACALLNLLLAQAGIAAGMTWPSQPLSAPGSLAVTHLFTLGWLTLLMLGALFQFVPVITNRPLPSQRLVLVVLIMFEAGLAMMLAGFIGLAGPLGALLPPGAVLVLLAVVLALADLLPPLWRAAGRNLSARCLLAGSAALIVTAALGIGFALALRVPALAAHLGPLLGGALPAHLMAGLAGWLTLTAIGVSYKLIPMFLLAPERRGVLGEGVFAAMSAGFALSVAGAVGQAIGHAAVWGHLENAGLALIALAIVLYVVDMARIYRSRRRRQLELHHRAALAAFAALALLLPAMLLWRIGLRHAAPLLVVLALTGWLSGLGLTQLYKIVPFLSWLVNYGRQLGSAAVPRVQDLVRERRAMPAFWLFFSSAALQALGAALARAGLFRGGAALGLLATVLLGLEYWRSWTTHYARHATRADAPVGQP